MTLLIPTGAAAVAQALQHSGTTRPAFVTYAVDVDVNTDAIAIANACHTAFQTSLKAQIDAGCSISTCTVRIGTGVASEPIVGDSTNAAVVGGLGGTTLPPNNAILIKKSTSRGGRRGRGRLFLPYAIANTEVAESGLLNGAKLTAMQTAVTAWLGALQTANFPMLLLHNEGQSAPGTPSDVTGLSVDPLISTQRRRLGR